MKAYFFKHNLEFNMPSRTSRDVLYNKPSWYLVIRDQNRIGVGECSIIPGLSLDRVNYIETKLDYICREISSGNKLDIEEFNDYPAIKFALETALRDFDFSESPFKINDSNFSNFKDKIKINGLVWMGDIKFMRSQIIEKVNRGFSCIKIKVGALKFESELQLIKEIRRDFTHKDLEIRLDANGAFKINEALEKLERLNEFSIHSIEQPIKKNHWQEMAKLCELSPIPIALDEELIGINLSKTKLLNTIKPDYLILKPSLLGGFTECDNWISLAQEKEIKWWATSALEGNVGLNAIAQWVYTKNSKLRQGLGTGMLFKNNVNSPLEISADSIYLNENKEWDLNFFIKIEK
jgi:o-succinylbenzoate synthase